MNKITRFGMYALLATASLAALMMLFHALPFTRQPDVQHIEYAFELLKAVYDGKPMEYLLTPQKYPLLSVLPLAVLYVGTLGALRLTGTLPSFAQNDIEHLIFTDPSAIHLVTRLVVLLSGVLLCILVYRLSRKLFPSVHPLFSVALLLSSMLLLTLMTAMRQHVPEIFLTVLTFAMSLRLAEEKSLRNEIFAFGAAAVAFSVLQNGIFALIFPLWAMAMQDGNFIVTRLFRSRLFLFVAGFILFSMIFGYTFLWKELILDHKLGFGLGNEDVGETPIGMSGFSVLGRTLLGSEFFLVVFMALTLWQWKQGRIVFHPFLWSMLSYMAVYALFFGFIGWATPRYFFPLVPFLAILAAPSFARATWVHPVFLVLFLFVHLKLAWLGFLPDTYDLARTFVLEETSGPIASTVPHYHLGIPPTRASISTPTTAAKERFILSLPEDLPNARDYVTAGERASARVSIDYAADPVAAAMPEGWSACRTIVSAPTSDAMFLWAEEGPWPLYWIFRTKYLGPSIVIGCR